MPGANRSNRITHLALINMPTQNRIYSFPRIVADLVTAFVACPTPIDRGGFHTDKSKYPRLTLDDLTPTDAFNFELARVWLRNFNPHREVETKRKFQWGAYQIAFPSGYQPKGGILILAAQSLGFEVVHHKTALSDRYNLQILLLNIENREVIDFFGRKYNGVKSEIDILCATPAVQMLLEADRIAGEKLLAELTAEAAADA